MQENVIHCYMSVITEICLCVTENYFVYNTEL
jgi:hypothetical protein